MTKLPILEQISTFRTKFKFLSNFSNFDHFFFFLALIFEQIFNFCLIFKFWPNLQFFPNFQFSTNFQFLSNFPHFDQIYNFFQIYNFRPIFNFCLISHILTKFTIFDQLSMKLWLFFWKIVIFWIFWFRFPKKFRLKFVFLGLVTSEIRWSSNVKFAQNSSDRGKRMKANLFHWTRLILILDLILVPINYFW